MTEPLTVRSSAEWDLVKLSDFVGDGGRVCVGPLVRELEIVADACGEMDGDISSSSDRDWLLDVVKSTEKDDVVDIEAVMDRDAVGSLEIVSLTE